MCLFALIGAACGRAELLQLLVRDAVDFDTDVAPAAGALDCFPPEDEVVCLTLGGCSCALLDGVGLTNRRLADAHAGGPGYAFRRALAEAVLRFGEVHLLAYSSAGASMIAADLGRRSTTLGNFLRFGLHPNDGLVCITA